MNQIKELREKNGLRQADLAKKLNISRTTVAKWENGQNFPRRKNLVKLIQILKCDANDLLCNKQ